VNGVTNGCSNRGGRGTDTPNAYVDSTRRSFDGGDNSMKVLAVTSFRPHEIADPLEYVNADVRLVDIESSNCLVPRVLDTFRTVRREIKEQEPDVLLLDVYELVGLVAVLLGLRYRIPIVCRLVGDRWREFSDEAVARARRQGSVVQVLKEYLSIGLNSFIYRSADGFIVVSTELKDVVATRT
jgi:hypothetical protein